MQFVIALACRTMGLTPAQAIAASTINSAHAIRRADTIGSLEAGKHAELLILSVPDYRHLGYRFGTNLVKLGFISEDDITSFLSRQYGVPSINLYHFEIDGTVIKLIPSEIAQKHQVIPINRTGNILTVAMADPSNIFAIDDVKFMTGFKIEPVVAAETSIKNAINKYYDSAGLVEDIMKTFDDQNVEALKDDEDAVNAAELGKAEPSGGDESAIRTDCAASQEHGAVLFSSSMKWANRSALLSRFLSSVFPCPDSASLSNLPERLFC